MPRSIWTGSISFGLVTIPVKLATAVRDRSIHFHMLSQDGQCRLRRKLYCPETGEEFDFSETSRGYEVAPGQYVVIKDEELKQVKPDAGRTIDITDYVDLTEIDPIYFDRSYLLLPGEGGAKAYKLLTDAMAETNRVGIATFVMRQKQYLAAIRSVDGALVLSTMHYADEVTLPAEIKDELPGQVKVNAGEKKIAQQLIDTLTTDFDPGKYKDEYSDKVREMIEAKVEGEQFTTVTEEPEEAPPVYNLMEALKESLEKTKTKEKPKKQSSKKKTQRRKSA